MSLAELCTRYRETERKALKPFLVASLIGSAVLHSCVLAWVLPFREDARSHLATTNDPVTVLVVDPTEPQVNPRSNLPNTTPVPRSTELVDSQPATAVKSAELPAPMPAIAAIESVSSRQKSLHPILSAAEKPAMADPAQSVDAMMSAPLAPVASTALPLVQRDPSPVSASTQPTNSQTLLQTLLSAIPIATGVRSSQTGVEQPKTSISSRSQLNQPGRDRPGSSGSSGSGSTEARSMSSAGQSAKSAGTGQSVVPELGASKLTGLVARNLSQGFPDSENNRQANSLPVCIVCSQPVYPSRAQQLGHRGQVRISVDFDANGSVTNVHLVQSSGYEELDHATVEQARSWKFKPATGGYRDFLATINFHGHESPSAPLRQPPSSTETIRQPRALEPHPGIQKSKVEPDVSKPIERSLAPSPAAIAQPLSRPSPTPDNLPRDNTPRVSDLDVNSAPTRPIEAVPSPPSKPSHSPSPPASLEPK